MWPVSGLRVEKAGRLQCPQLQGERTLAPFSPTEESVLRPVLLVSEPVSRLQGLWRLSPCKGDLSTRVIGWCQAEPWGTQVSLSWGCWRCPQQVAGDGQPYGDARCSPEWWQVLPGPPGPGTPPGPVSTSGLSPLHCAEPQRVWRALAPAGGCEEVPLCPRICSFIPNVLLDQALSLVALLCCFAPAAGMFVAEENPLGDQLVCSLPFVYPGIWVF